MPWTFCTKNDVISIHPTTETALPDFWSDAVEDLIREHLGTPNLGADVPVVGELHDGTNGTYLMFRQPPVVSVQSVYINGGLVEPDSYTTTRHGIELFDQVIPAGNNNVRVDYISGGSALNEIGQPTIAPKIRLCAAAMIVAISTYKSRAGSDGSIKWSQAPVKEGSNTVTFDIGLVDHLYKIIRRMLRRDRLRVR